MRKESVAAILRSERGGPFIKERQRKPTFCNGMHSRWWCDLLVYESSMAADWDYRSSTDGNVRFTVGLTRKIRTDEI